MSYMDRTVYPADIWVSPLQETQYPTVVTHFTIKKEIDKGGASRCYEAIHPNSGSGVLKEFWPSDFPELCLDENENVCLPSGEKRQLFEKRLEQYVQPYLAMLRKKQDGKETAQQLASFIPAYELYRGCLKRTGTHSGTAYIWIPIPEYATFKKVCNEIRENPTENPQYKLVQVLKAISELTSCVHALHDAGMLHRDIKPANFGFLTRNQEVLEQTLSFFDLDTVCSCYDTYVPCCSEGFSDPSPETDNPNKAPYLRDIYSIGATLFHSLAIRANEDGYNRKDNDDFFSLVASSPLIKACQLYAHPNLNSQLARILERCLGSRRYATCAVLQQDLRIALSYIMPKATDKNGNWVWREAIKHFDKKHNDKTRLALQYHLYKDPLYNYITKNSNGNYEQINILVLGFGYYGQTFTDSCLQAGQLPNVELNLTVVSDNPLDRNAYLEARPELCRFVDIDGSLTGDPEKYASIDFVHQKLLPNRKCEIVQVETDALIDTFDSVCKKSNPSYIMIALGNDELNLNVAKQCQNLMDDNVAIYYICEGEVLTIEDATQIKPVYVFENIRKQKEFSDLERMAFNTHIVWKKSMGIDFNAEREKFIEDSYNHHSSLDYVLALKCKLYAFGINLDQTSFSDAAKKIQDKIADRKCNAETRSIRNTLIWLEHRRWVLEKITKGWRTIIDLEECAALGKQKDDANKRHACIRRSQPNQYLAAYYCKGKEPIVARWDDNEAISPKAKPLDELDQMSLDLHRVYLRAAIRQKQENWGKIGIPALQSIENRLKKNPDAFCSWKEFRACLEDIWHGEQKRTHHYTVLQEAFQNSIMGFGKEELEIINAELAKLDIIFKPILASAEYTDFKREDVKLVDEIPFILTYATPSCMIVPYVTGDSSDLFQNIAAPLTVNPTDLVFLHHCNDEKSLEGFTQSIARVVSFLKRKKISERIYVYVTCMEDINQGNQTVDNALAALSVSLSEKTVTIVKNDQEALCLFRRYLNKWKKRESICAVEENDSNLSWMLRGAQLYTSRAHYRFDASTMTFSHTEGCPMFSHISKKPYLSVADIMSLANGISKSGTTPEFFDCYSTLWEKSRVDNGFPWKNLCYALRTHSETNDVLAKFASKTFSSKVGTYQYDIEYVSQGAVEKILSALKEYRLIGQESSITLQGMKTYLVTIHDLTGNKAQFDKLFCNQSCLTNAEAISIYEKKNFIYVYWDQLRVEGLNFNCFDDTKKTSQARFMLKLLADNQFVSFYAESAGVVSFCYKSTAFKHLFMNEGRILEVYVYHKLKEADFDGVASGYEVYWKDRRVKNEFDCIAVKGYQSIFMETKFTTSLNQEYYFKLAGLVRQFGVNAQAVLIADTGERENEEKSANQMQRARGEMMGITTIWKEDDIRHIDKILLDILQNESKSE